MPQGLRKRLVEGFLNDFKSFELARFMELMTLMVTRADCSLTADQPATNFQQSKYTLLFHLFATSRMITRD
jgi:hypothetical protein